MAKLGKQRYIRLTEEQDRVIVRDARRLGVSVSDYLRLKLVEAGVLHVPVGAQKPDEPQQNGANGER